MYFNNSSVRFFLTPTFNVSLYAIVIIKKNKKCPTLLDERTIENKILDSRQQFCIGIYEEMKCNVRKCGMKFTASFT